MPARTEVRPLRSTRTRDSTFLLSMQGQHEKAEDANLSDLYTTVRKRRVEFIYLDWSRMLRKLRDHNCICYDERNNIVAVTGLGSLATPVNNNFIIDFASAEPLLITLRNKIKELYNELGGDDMDE